MSSKKKKVIEELVREYRESGNNDRAFDNRAAERLGINQTDLHCVNIIENTGGIGAGELAKAAGLTTGAVTGVIDRLEQAGYARRVPDPADRRRVRVEVTPGFYAKADAIWGPLREDWGADIAGRFTAEQLQQVIDFLRAANELATRHLGRLADDSR